MFAHPLLATPSAGDGITLYVDDLVCDAHIGAHADEYHRSQKIVVRVALRLDELPGADCTELHQVLDYNLVRNAVLARAQGEHVVLQETLCRLIAGDCLALPGVASVYVAVGKLQAFADCRAVGCELVRHRAPPSR